jgi:hypothetical protein
MICRQSSRIVPTHLGHAQMKYALYRLIVDDTCTCAAHHYRYYMRCVMEVFLDLIIVLLGILGLTLMGVRLFRLSRNQTNNRQRQHPATSHVPEQQHPAKSHVPESSGSVENKRWLKLVEECVELYDQLDRNRGRFDRAGRELTDHVTYRLQEILDRCGVELIAGEMTFDYTRHQPEQTTASVAVGAPIAETLSPGFSLGRRVLRRARVRLAEAPPTKAT